MKKSLILLLLLTSCGYATMDNSKAVVITSIEESTNEGYCNYYGKGNVGMVNTLPSTEFKFRDKCGKFQIGDTIKLIK